MRIALTFATAALLSTVAFAQANPAYAPPPPAGAPYSAPYDAHGGGDTRMGSPAGPDQKAAHRARRRQKLASMTPAQRAAWKEKKKARRATRQDGSMQRPGA